MAVDADLRTYVLADGTVAGLIGTRCFQNSVPTEKTALPFIWFRRARTNELETLAADEDWTVEYDMECVSDDLDQAITLRDAVLSRLRGHQGTMGDGTYNWVHCRDQYDTYVPRNIEADERLQIASLSVEVTL
jgi:hypothetical protein